MIPAFEGAEINGKQFPFIRITISEQPVIINKFKPKFRDAFFPSKQNKRMWKRVRSVAFVKDWKWKYLRIIPKELRCSQMLLKQAGEIQASFFLCVEEAVNGHDLPLISANPSLTGSEQKK